MNIVDSRRVFDSIYKTGNPDESKSLKAWQSRAVTIHNAILAVKDQIDAQGQELAETYQPRAVDELMKPVKDAFYQIVSEERKKLTDDLDELLTGKMEQFRAVALSAPSEEQNRLLTSLSFRDDLTEAEVARIAEGMGDNHQALRALRSIARKNGVEMISPPSVEAVEADIAEARENAVDCLRSLDTADGELGYFHRGFYSGYDLGQRFSRLDNNIFTQPQARKTATQEQEAENGKARHSDR